MNKIFWLILLTCCSINSLYTQSEKASSDKYFFFPSEKKYGEMNYFAGLAMAQLPTKIVEDVFDQVPMIELSMSYGLPYNLYARADLSTNVLTNQLTLSPIYSYSFNKLSLAVGNDALLWYGFFNSDGFDVSVLGWGLSPFVSAGYDFDEFSVTLKAESNFKSQNSYMKGLKYKDDGLRFVGTVFTIAVEQPLWGDNYVALGFRAYYTKFFYKSWLSFSTFDQYMFYPEFFAGFVL